MKSVPRKTKVLAKYSIHWLKDVITQRHLRTFVLVKKDGSALILIEKGRFQFVLLSLVLVRDRWDLLSRPWFTNRLECYLSEWEHSVERDISNRRLQVHLSLGLRSITSLNKYYVCVWSKTFLCSPIGRSGSDEQIPLTESSISTFNDESNHTTHTHTHPRWKTRIVARFLCISCRYNWTTKNGGCGAEPRINYKYAYVRVLLLLTSARSISYIRNLRKWCGMVD